MKLTLKKHSKLISLAGMICLTLTGIQAQEAILTVGGTAKGNGGSVSYSAGQIEYATYSGETGSLEQGVQHPYHISVILGANEDPGIQLEYIAYPNPANDILFLQLNTTVNEEMYYQLFDAMGNFLGQNSISGATSTIDFIDYLPGTYLLQIIDKDSPIKTFKIIKTN